MKPLTHADLLSHADYEAQRPAYRKEIIALKKRRRIEVGPQVTILFENRETLCSQIQEMVRAERIFQESKIQDELDVYNAILPQPGELSATLMIEITDDDRIKTILDSFQGMDRSDTLSIEIQDEKVFAQFEAGHSKEDKISAVHFIRFSIPQPWISLLKAHGSNASMHIRHENYVAEVQVPEEMKEEWLKDLES